MAPNPKTYCCTDPKRANGFTLVELLVVLAIIAIVAGVVSPYARGSLRGRQLQDAALTFAEHVKYAQALAVNQGRVARVCLKLQEQAYQVEIARDFAGQDFEPVPGPAGVTQSLIHGVRFGEVKLAGTQGQADALIFAPTDQWTVGSVHLTNGQRAVLVKISQGLGHVEIASAPADQ